MGDPMKPAEFERMLGMFGDAVDTKTDEVSSRVACTHTCLWIYSYVCVYRVLAF
jgi:hypothetical protein